LLVKDGTDDVVDGGAGTGTGTATIDPLDELTGVEITK
jgi:hypothetical protein